MHLDDVIKNILFLSLLCKTNTFHVTICSLIDQRGCQNGSCAAFLFLSHFDVTCDLLLNSHMATLNPSVTVHSQKPGPLRQ